ncbi:putative transcription repressor NiaR [Clostridium pasteurianum DSM 525 = ATCC 6013]|uniref:3H domain-containing protein n=1 Tax=Clostridium pasteurianum DSM 525 = ATCC 6013 TaxID=1262449 RepID=A0A0H3IYR6_CLOPA|nr:transcription repressor NadR [Clostridium pasteurianum]AJA46149.1 putative transcription repressor NiaR [Clostridium pasteurianum DSM 525 = ATCC 6013]AJA50137.1 putative transcription repressor NiaR [Clostridium pasteurianum DSM 525 = ATCC 6013]AOZ73611.1 transcriptional regulator [Clostridium pasteurianum DSM 525 = ATCC 6013]AOZ81038.1 transcriptional regulator [Clostridium pasteurianum]ELP57732.1 transcriptional regulator [Clostridium pasteurianum DSM 525 = ATCC 6013]
MNSEERRNFIKDILKKEEEPLKGNILSEKFGVTRQIIVKDIAILRASGVKIISTPKGYIIPKNKDGRIKKIIALCHSVEDIEDELLTIVKWGGIIEDVIIEHKLYGEIKGILMIKNILDVKNFILKLDDYKNEPLCILTGGIHLHTITAKDEKSIENILRELKNKNYLISD